MRGNAPQTKMHYKGKNDDFVIFVDSASAVQEWKKDKSTPLAQVVSGWKVFVTHKSVHPADLALPVPTPWCGLDVHTACAD